MLRNRNTNNLLEELEGRHAAVQHARSIGLPASYANFQKNQIRAIKNELARRRQALLNNLRAQLKKLRTARDAGNRGNMVNIYSSMGNKWTSVPNGRAAAAVMNNAQKIMFNAGLLLGSRR